MTRPRPRFVRGLGAEVEILYDRAGVPHVRASCATDAYFAQGYATAEARLWQLDLFRRTAAGRLAECFGAKALGGDRFQRTLGLAALAERGARRLAPAPAARLGAYACGVNAFAEASATPPELACLGIGFEPWTVTDTMLCVELRAILNASWRADLIRLQVVARAGAKRAADLFLDYEMPDGRPERAAPAHFDERLLADCLDVVRDSEDALALLGLQHSDIGSNTWACDGGRTLSGKPLLANDLHMGFVVPNPNFLIHLSAPGLDVRGVSFPGVPGVLTGHNERIAWGSTACLADSQDVFVEELDESGTRYRFRREWLPLESRTEAIRVGGGGTDLLEVRGTHHGPLVRSRGRWGLALRWERLDAPSGDPSMHALNTAGDWRSFREALRTSSLPPADFTYADVDGNIGAQTAGRVPIRSSGDGSVPAPGRDGAYEWTGFVPFDELPRTYRPDAGFVVRANQNHDAGGCGHFLSRRWHPPYRARRIAEMLAAGGGHGVESFAAIQFDRFHGHGEFLRRRLVDALGMPHASLLRRWDGQLHPDSAAAAIVKECAATLKTRLLEPILGKRLLFAYQQNWPISNLVVESILEREDRAWLPDGVSSFSELLRQVAAAALESLCRTFGTDRADDWRWGRLNTARFVHPLAHAGLAPERTAVAEVEVGADGECPFSARGVGDYVSAQQTAMLGETGGRAAIFGASARLVWDPGDWDNSSLLLNLGQSGDPDSVHFRDQLELWRTGAVQKLPFSAERLRTGCVRRVLLVAPGSAAPTPEE